MGRVGFEPTKAQGQQIYSLLHLTALEPTHSHPNKRRLTTAWSRKQDLNPRPTVYKTVALPTELFRHDTILRRQFYPEKPIISGFPGLPYASAGNHLRPGFYSPQLYSL